MTDLIDIPQRFLLHETFRSDTWPYPTVELVPGIEGLLCDAAVNPPKIGKNQAFFHNSGSENGPPGTLSERDILWVEGRLNMRRETDLAAVTAKFDEYLADRVAAFQRAHELFPATGALDQRTVALLAERSPNEPVSPFSAES